MVRCLSFKWKHMRREPSPVSQIDKSLFARHCRVGQGSQEKVEARMRANDSRECAIITVRNLRSLPCALPTVPIIYYRMYNTVYLCSMTVQYDDYCAFRSHHTYPCIALHCTALHCIAWRQNLFLAPAPTHTTRADKPTSEE